MLNTCASGDPATRYAFASSVKAYLKWSMSCAQTIRQGSSLATSTFLADAHFYYDELR